jgi:uncharacterized protein (TIGR02246 family)
MFRTTRRGALVWVFAAGLAACGGRGTTSSAPPGAEADVAAIRALIAEIEPTFKSGDIDAAMKVFTDDAVILAQGMPDVVGKEAIRALYQGMMDQYVIDAHLTTKEIQVAGDLGYERGTYTLKLTDKASGKVVADVVNRHVHILRRQPDGSWKTWRMIVNSTERAQEGQ